jgi:hypothetical protein
MIDMRSGGNHMYLLLAPNIHNTLLLSKATLPSKGLLFVNVNADFEAVCMLHNDQNITVLGGGRKKLFSRKKLRRLYFVRKQINVPFNWHVDEIPTDNNTDCEKTSNATGFLYISVQNSRKLISRFYDNNEIDAGEVVRLLAKKEIIATLRDAFTLVAPGSYNIEKMETGIAEKLFNIFNRYGLNLDNFTITSHEIHTKGVMM